MSSDRSVTNIVSMRHGVGTATEVLLEFSGELFELEDQRNWTDASYKTFCTPLHLPRPVQITAGEAIEQTVRISSTSSATAVVAPPPKRGIHARAQVSVELGADGPIMPSIGVLSTPQPDALEAAKALGVSHVRSTVDASRMTRSEMYSAVESLASSGLDFELEMVTDDPAAIEPIQETIAVFGERLTNAYLFDRKTQITPSRFRQTIDRVRMNTGLRLGGGSGTNFGAINFNIDEIPLDALNTLTFPMSPQVHYTDTFTLFMNLEAQRTVAANGHRIADGRSLSVGPVTLLPRRAGDTLARDPRSNSLLAAAWTVGSLSQLMASDAQALTYHEVTGSAGIVRADGALTPTYHVLADVAGYPGARVAPTVVRATGARVAAVALQRDREMLVMIANLESRPVEVALDFPTGTSTMRVLDETVMDLARHDRSKLTATATSWSGENIPLRPFAIATLVVAE